MPSARLKKSVLSLTRVVSSPQTVLVGWGRCRKTHLVPAEQIRELLLNWGRSDLNAREEMIPPVYGELRRTPRRYFWQERSDRALQSEPPVPSVCLRLPKLAARKPKLSRLLAPHFIGGLSIDETRIFLGISPATAQREWLTARPCHSREMKQRETRR
jgi:hypothetical protein